MNELKTTKNDSMEKNSTEKFTFDNQEMPSLKWIFFARLIDIVISMVPGLILNLIIKADDWKSAVIITSISFILIFFYFIVLAYLCKGNTIGKLMVGIRIKKTNDKKINFIDVTRRELYYTFVPWFFFLIVQVIVIVIAYNYNYDGKNKFYTTFCLTLKNISVLFYAVWFIYLGLTIKIQEDHQSAIDYRLKIICIKNSYSKPNETLDSKIEKENVHLGENKPGQMNLDELNQLLEEKKDD